MGLCPHVALGFSTLLAMLLVTHRSHTENDKKRKEFYASKVYLWH